MGKLMNIVTPLHKKTKRDYIDRIQDKKVHCMKVAKEYGQDYWDGNRRFGYGGYRYDGRWKVVAEKLIDVYGLKDNAKILDVGCGKAHLLYEFTQLLSNCTVKGIDISGYALENAKEEVRSNLFQHRAQDKYAFDDNEFDLVISITTLHNLAIFDLKKAIGEMERVGKNKYVVVESFRNETELFNLQCWALTCESFFGKQEWEWLLKEFDYSGDFEFIYFE